MRKVKTDSASTALVARDAENQPDSEWIAFDAAAEEIFALSGSRFLAAVLAEELSIEDDDVQHVLSMLPPEYLPVEEDTEES